MVSESATPAAEQSCQTPTVSALEVGAQHEVLVPSASGHAPATTNSGCDTDLAARGDNVGVDVVENAVGGTSAGAHQHTSGAKASPGESSQKRKAASSKEEPSSKKVMPIKKQGEAGNMGGVKTSES